jgi:glucose/arabinose dehydrogenase/mono/diheme cytochrome c family protein
MTEHTLSLALLLASAGALAAAPQSGDRPGEEQPPLPADLQVPPAPALSAQQELETFALPPGLVIECVASEPLVVDPVDVAFDGDGRLWVVEMRSYMPDIDGTGETAPTGRVAVLSDEDGDGLMDSREDFLEGLVLPRGVMPYRDGALVLVPPELRFYRDTDGDGRADHHVVIERGLGGIQSPEHAANAPRWTHDNWVQLSNHRLRYREEDGAWLSQPTNGGGQWGLSLDETGRAYFNTNSDGLRGDLYSSHYALRNASYGTAGGVNVRLAKDQSVWPARMTPGVNRGYRKETLRDDFTLAAFTGACGPLVYLGDALPAEYRGDAFVAEPCGNLVKRFRLRDGEGLALSATNAYEGREFLTSTDERFRPVNLVDGPDGALYVVDLYRGVLQHRLFVTSWLRKQVEERGLEEPLGLGRIWRIRPDSWERAMATGTSEASWTELVAALGSMNGWQRMTAQRVIVEEGVGDADAIELLREAISARPSALARAHALQALTGIGALDEASALTALGDEDQRVQLAGLRCAEESLSLGSEAVLAQVARLARGGDERVRHQALLSLGVARTRAADGLLKELASEDCSSKLERAALLSGVHGRELSLLTEMLSDEGWHQALAGRYELVQDLARCIVREGRSDRIGVLLSLVATALHEEAWHGEAMIAGMLAGRPRGPKGEPVAIAMPAQPDALAALSSVRATPGTARVTELVNAITWPGGPNAGGSEVRPLTAEEQSSFERGRLIFADICSTCHQTSGLGEAGKAPPLRNSPWLLGAKQTPIRILLGGLTGPIEVAGQEWDLEMPVYAPDAAHIADVLTYVRREWGHGADSITAEDVRAVQEEMKARTSPWTAEELKAADQE